MADSDSSITLLDENFEPFNGPSQIAAQILSLSHQTNSNQLRTRPQTEDSVLRAIDNSTTSSAPFTVNLSQDDEVQIYVLLAMTAPGEGRVELLVCPETRSIIGEIFQSRIIVIDSQLYKVCNSSAIHSIDQRYKELHEEAERILRRGQAMPRKVHISFIQTHEGAPPSQSNFLGGLQTCDIDLSSLYNMSNWKTFRYDGTLWSELGGGLLQLSARSQGLRQQSTGSREVQQCDSRLNNSAVPHSARIKLPKWDIAPRGLIVHATCALICAVGIWLFNSWVKPNSEGWFRYLVEYGVIGVLAQGVLKQVVQPVITSICAFLFLLLFGR